MIKQTFCRGFSGYIIINQTFGGGFMLTELNPFVRYANILAVNDSHKTMRIGLDCRLFYCISGFARIKIKDEIVELTKGAMVFIPPYTKYCFCGFEKDKNVSLAILNFDLTSFKSDFIKPLPPVVYKLKKTTFCLRNFHHILLLMMQEKWTKV